MGDSAPLSFEWPFDHVRILVQIRMLLSPLWICYSLVISLRFTVWQCDIPRLLHEYAVRLLQESAVPKEQTVLAHSLYDTPLALIPTISCYYHLMILFQGISIRILTLNLILLR